MICLLLGYASPKTLELSNTRLMAGLSLRALRHMEEPWTLCYTRVTRVDSCL